MRSLKIIEWLAIGGVSLLAWPLVQIYNIDSLTSLGTLILLFSLPHFALSYMLFYSQKGLARQHWIAAFAFPSVLLTTLVLLGGSKVYLSYFVQTGFLMFFHHIAKQAFGVGLFYSGQPTQHSRVWKYSLLFACLAWGLSTWLEQQSKPGTFMAFKSFVDTLEIHPRYAQWTRYFAISMTGVCVLAWIWIARRNVPSVTLMAWTPLLALIVWCQPQLGLTPLGLMPVLHGFQYMPFAWKKLSKEGWRPSYAIAFALAAVPLGYLLFQASSTWLFKSAGSSGALVAVLYVFLNVHHYVLDRFMWTRRTFYDRKAPTTPEDVIASDIAA